MTATTARRTGRPTLSFLLLLAMVLTVAAVPLVAAVDDPEETRVPPGWRLESSLGVELAVRLTGRSTTSAATTRAVPRPHSRVARCPSWRRTPAAATARSRIAPRNAANVFVVAVIAVAVLSCVPLFTLGFPVVTALVLASMHLVAGLVVLVVVRPAMRLRLGSGE